MLKDLRHGFTRAASKTDFSARSLTASVPAVVPVAAVPAMIMPIASSAEVVIVSMASTVVAAIVVVVIVVPIVVAGSNVAIGTIIRTVRPMVPGAGSDEDAICKPCGAVVAIGRAGIGIVAVIPVSAGGRSIVSVGRSGADSYADRYLGMGIGRGENQDAKQCKVS